MKIPVYKPWLTNTDRDNLLEAFDSSWIASGKFIGEFEAKIAQYVGVGHAMSASNGTTALYLCFKALGIRPGDKVIVPTLTYAASAFAVSHCGAECVFVDSDPDTWNMDLDQTEKILSEQNIKAVLVVHLLGNPVDMDRVNTMAKKYGAKVVEDACESLGATLNGAQTGSLSHIACFSFYGNKTITGGEGGCVVTNDDNLATQVRMFRGQAQHPAKRYWHIDKGWNFRLTNLQASILVSQMARLNEIIQIKQHIADVYKENLPNVKIQELVSGATHSNWMVAIKTKMINEDLIDRLDLLGIETRRMFYPLTDMEPYLDKENEYPVAKDLSEYCIMLPSFPELSDDEIKDVCRAIGDSLTG